MEVHINQIEKRSWIEVDMSQLKKNFFIYRDNLKRRADIMAVLKADAYGHGDAQVARMLEDVGVHLFAVSNIDEAVSLRDAGIKGEILILGYTSPYYCRTLYDKDLTQAIVSEQYAEVIAKSNLKIKTQFAIDTGMNRIGLDGDETEECNRIIRKYSHQLNVNGIFTHLCVADTNTIENKEFTYNQISKFRAIADALKDLGLPYVHCCNSAGGLFYLNNSKDYEDIGGIVRLGIVLYGLKPDYHNTLPVGIAPALTWKSTISLVKKVKKGETVGYGRTYLVNEDKIIATVTTGYADGLNRLLSNKGFFLVNGKKAPIVGRICMDQTLVDVTDIPDVKMGDKVVILGKSGDLEYNADDMAEDLGTIGYEIVCGITKRVQRFYVTSYKYL
jgi:alanine racemase